MCWMDVSLQMASGSDANTTATMDLFNFLLITGAGALAFDGSYLIHQVNLMDIFSAVGATAYICMSKVL